MIVLPSFTAHVEQHADWVEMAALAQGFYSWSDYQRDHRIGLSAAEADHETLSSAEPFERLIDGISAEITARRIACDGFGRYPFAVDDFGLTSRPYGLAYRFLLLLSTVGQEISITGIDSVKLFEDLCAYALSTYLGPEHTEASCLVFGSPRTTGPKGFADAVDDLCRRLGEGRCHQPGPRTTEMMDAGMDIVAWKHFPDSRPGKLILFGQCSTGKDWHKKLRDLIPADWCTLWMSEMPTVLPMSAFLIPHRVREDLWREANVKGGVVFDRCRIAWLCSDLPQRLQNPISAWCDGALRQMTAGGYAA